MDPLAALARHGPWVLVSGLFAGLATPPELNALRDFIPLMVVVLLFLSVFRIDPRALLGPLRDLPRVVRTILTLQLALPLAVIALGALLGASEAPFLLAVTLAAAAPAIVGSPNICAMMGIDPAQSLRLLIVGTVLMPLTVLPVFWASTSLEGLSAVLLASQKLLITLGVTIGVASLARMKLAPELAAKSRQRLDGLSAVWLALFVVGLMPEVRELALHDPLRASLWMGVAFLVNWGAQGFTYWWTGNRTGRDTRVATSVYAGNRNIALFLVALPREVTEPILVFVGCYQIPMYLTPMAMRAIYQEPAVGE